MTKPVEKQAYSVKSFCAAYDVGKSFAYQEMSAGRLPALHVGRRVLIRKSDAEAWLQSRAKPRQYGKCGAGTITVNKGDQNPNTSRTASCG